ncbi:hypothetical protein Q9R46_18495 [Paenibacillus sp. RRE4]|nr:MULTISPECIES: hypothetical protein [Paenibacillus]MDT0124659.1 hypothetical protein [Paenibacillus sp. RRE4]
MIILTCELYVIWHNTFINVFGEQTAKMNASTPLTYLAKANRKKG